ncbi:MAG: Stp1/IreP family PP2C-type Ser/Thr phosphatase [Leptolyngbyaceae bacterium]|nr:Stp1/IreP family PP2C-type Ser/Thr phosphatase [Leptolyngbyaceae bacterium]
MKRLFTGLTDPGLVRTANQDAYYTDQSGRFFIVADGMGGHAGGQEASRIATEVIQQCLLENWDSSCSSKDLLTNAVLNANRAIIDDQAHHPERADMGTTVLVVVFRDEQPMCAHIGDSRLYRLRGSRLDQITEDHTWVARAMKLGDLSPTQARVHPWRHVLSKCLGREDLKQVDIQSFDWQPNDRLLLCSDGLTEELSDHLISNHMKSIRSCDKAANALVDAAKESGGRDNITVIVVATET